MKADDIKFGKLETEFAVEYFSDLISWDKVSHVKKLCSEINKRYFKEQKHYDDTNPSYNALIRAFKLYHPQFYDKTLGDKIEYFFSDMTDKVTPAIHFKLLHYDIDDNTIGFSSFVKDRSIIHKRDVLGALRTAIMYDKHKVKFQAIENGKKCRITGVLLTDENIHVHHNGETFQEIADKWVSIHGGYDILYNYVNNTIGEGTDIYLTDKTLNQDWLNYHREHSHLEALSKEGHKIIHTKNM